MTRSLPRRWTGLLLLVLTAALAGCAGAPSPTTLKAQLVAASAINPDLGGRPSPVVVRIYALKASSAFENADFFSLYDNEQATLKTDLLARDELEMMPGGEKQISREFPPDVQYLGVVAAFRDIDQAQWRAIAPLKKESKNALTIELGERSISIRSGP